MEVTATVDGSQDCEQSVQAFHRALPSAVVQHCLSRFVGRPVVVALIPRTLDQSIERASITRHACMMHGSSTSQVSCAGISTTAEQLSYDRVRAARVPACQHQRCESGLRSLRSGQRLIDTADVVAVCEHKRQNVPVSCLQAARVSTVWQQVGMAAGLDFQKPLDCRRRFLWRQQCPRCPFTSSIVGFTIT